MTTTVKPKVPVGRPKTPKDVAERSELVRIANLAGSILISLRQPGRGVYSSERELRQWLNEDGVQFTTGDIAHALVLLESKGNIRRATVKPNAPGRWSI